METEEVLRVEQAPPRPQRWMGYFDMHPEHLFLSTTPPAPLLPAVHRVQPYITRVTQPRGIPVFFLSYHSAPLALCANSYPAPFLSQAPGPVPPPSPRTQAPSPRQASPPVLPLP